MFRRVSYKAERELKDFGGVREGTEKSQRGNSRRGCKRE